MKNNLTPERIMQFAWGYAPTIIIRTALQHRVFDLLDEKPKTVEELAQATGGSQRGLTALLNALVGLQFLTRVENRYALTPESAAFLVSTKPGYHGAFFQHTIDQILPKWLQLPEVVRTGKPAQAVNEQDQGAEFFAGFVEALFPMGYQAARLLAEHLGVAKATSPVKVLDLAAGSGVWGIALAQQSPQVHISAADWPVVLETTKRVAARHGVQGNPTSARVTKSPSWATFCTVKGPGAAASSCEKSLLLWRREEPLLLPSSFRTTTGPVRLTRLFLRSICSSTPTKGIPTRLRK